MNRRSEPKDQPTDGRDRPTRHRAEPTTNDDSRRFKQRPERPERPDGGMINDVPVVRRSVRGEDPGADTTVARDDVAPVFGSWCLAASAGLVAAVNICRSLRSLWGSKHHPS